MARRYYDGLFEYRDGLSWYYDDACGSHRAENPAEPQRGGNLLTALRNWTLRLRRL